LTRGIKIAIYFFIRLVKYEDMRKREVRKKNRSGGGKGMLWGEVDHIIRRFCKNRIVSFRVVTIDGVLDYWIYWPLTGCTTNHYNTIAISTI
jgi:hypothetical protein